MQPTEHTRPIAAIRSKYVTTILSIALTGCNVAPNPIRIVNQHDYRHDMRCWENLSGEFEAFLTITDSAGLGIPYFVSGRCMVDGAFPNFRVSTLEMINAIKVRDPTKNLEERVGWRAIRDNLVTDLPAPGDDDPVYIFVGRLEQVRRSPPLFEIRQVKAVRKLDVSFHNLLATNPADRMTLFRASLQQLQRHTREHLIRDRSP